MSEFHTLLVRFRGEQPSYKADQEVLGGELIGVQFDDGFAEYEKLEAQRNDLLEACQEAEKLLSWLSGWALTEPQLQVIRAAIAKAQGN